MNTRKKGLACFHLCSSLLEIQGRLFAMKIPGISITMKELLAESRELKDYSQLKAYFSVLFEKYREQVQSMVKEKTELVRAREYIEEHYMENISLEILAQEVHMNPYYFSTYFKKGTGKNFKDYLNEVRLKHAITLLVTTDKLNYEIAAEVGYRDSRVFADTFQRWFGETPTVYRKRVKRKGQ